MLQIMNREEIVNQWCRDQVGQMSWHTVCRLATDSLIELFESLSDEELIELVDDCDELDYLKEDLILEDNRYG